MAELIQSDGYDARRLSGNTSLRGYEALKDSKSYRRDRRGSSRQGDFEDIIEVQPEESETAQKPRPEQLDLHVRSEATSQTYQNAQGPDSSHYGSGSGPSPRVRQEFAVAIYASNDEQGTRQNLPGRNLDLFG